MSLFATVKSLIAMLHQKHCGTFETTGFGYFVCVLDILGGDANSISLAAERFVEWQAYNNVSYTEVRYAPHTIAFSPKYKISISAGEAVDAVTEGLRAGMAKHPGTVVYQILCHDRKESPQVCLEVANLVHDKAKAAAGTPGRVVGMDLAGNETAFPNPPFVPCFKHAHALRNNITIHCGESPETTAESCRQAVVDMHATRVGHGYATALNDTVAKLLHDRGVFFEVCAFFWDPLPNILVRHFPNVNIWYLGGGTKLFLLKVISWA